MTLFHPTGWAREPAVKRARGVAPGPRLDRVFSCGRNPLSGRKVLVGIQWYIHT